MCLYDRRRARTRKNPLRSDDYHCRNHPRFQARLPPPPLRRDPRSWTHSSCRLSSIAYVYEHDDFSKQNSCREWRQIQWSSSMMRMIFGQQSDLPWLCQGPQLPVSQCFPGRFLHDRVLRLGAYAVWSTLPHLLQLMKYRNHEATPCFVSALSHIPKVDR